MKIIRRGRRFSPRVSKARVVHVHDRTVKRLQDLRDSIKLAYNVADVLQATLKKAIDASYTMGTANGNYSPPEFATTGSVRARISRRTGKPTRKYTRRTKVPADIAEGRD